MIELLSKNDLQKVLNERTREYLSTCFNRLPKEFSYPNDGYFILVEDFNELLAEKIKIGESVLPSIKNGLYEYINMVEIESEYVEILILLDNDFGVSLVVQKNTIPTEYLDEFKKFSI